MTATTESVHNQTNMPEGAPSPGKQLRDLVHHYLSDGPGQEDMNQDIHEIIWGNEYRLRWEVTFPPNSSDETLDTYALPAMIGVFSQRARAIREQVQNRQPLAVALDPRFLYDSLRTYNQAARTRERTMAEIMKPLEQSGGMIIDTHLAGLVRPYIERPQVHDVKPGQLLELSKFWPAIKAVHSIMYGKQVAVAAPNGHNGV